MIGIGAETFRKATIGGTTLARLPSKTVEVSHKSISSNVVEWVVTFLPTVFNQTVGEVGGKIRSISILLVFFSDRKKLSC